MLGEGTRRWESVRHGDALPCARLVKCTPGECEESGSEVRQAPRAPMHEDHTRTHNRSYTSLTFVCNFSVCGRSALN